MCTTSDIVPPVLTTSGESDAVKLRCGVLRATIMSAAAPGGTPPPINARTKTPPRIRLLGPGEPGSTQVRPKPDTTARSERLLGLSLETRFVAWVATILLRQDLTTPHPADSAWADPTDERPGIPYCKDRKSTRLNSSHSQISYA